MSDNGSGNDDTAGSTTFHRRRAYDWSETTPSLAAVDALASLEGVEPTELVTELETTLYDYVDPNALDTLVGNGNSTVVSVTFEIDSYRFQFEGDELTVCEMTDR